MPTKIQDQLDAHLAKADAVLRLVAGADQVEIETLQGVLWDAADHIRDARNLTMQLANEKGPAIALWPLGSGVRTGIGDQVQAVS